VAQKLAPFTFFVTSAPIHIEAHLSAHLPFWDDAGARTTAIQDIARHINSYYPQVEQKPEVVICNTNEMEQLQCEAHHFLYDLSGLCLVDQTAAERAQSGLLLRVSFFDAHQEREDSEIAPLVQWQKDAYKTILQIMAESPPAVRALPVLRSALSNLSRLHYLMLAKQSGTKWHDVAQIMSRADLQLAIAFAVDGARQSLLGLCNSQTISSTSQIKIRGRLNKLEGISRLQLKASPRVATIINTKNGLKRLISTKSATEAVVKRNSGSMNVEPAAQPRVMRSFKASAITPFEQHVAKAKAVTGPQALTSQVFTDFKQVARVVSFVVALPRTSADLNIAKPGLTASNANLASGLSAEKDADHVSKDMVLPLVADQPVRDFAPVKEAQIEISGSSQIAVEAALDPVQITSKNAEPFATAPILPEKSQTPVGSIIMSNDVLMIKELRERVIEAGAVANVIAPIDGANAKPDPAPSLTKKSAVTFNEPADKPAIKIFTVAAIPDKTSQVAGERQPSAPRAILSALQRETAISAVPRSAVKSPVQIPLEAPDKLKLQESAPAADKLTLLPPVALVENTPSAILPAQAAALVVQNDPVRSEWIDIHHQNLLQEKESIALGLVKNVVLLSAAKPVEDIGGDPELARLKRLKKARQYSQYGMC